MGLIDEALFGIEVIDRMPAIVREWVKIYREREAGETNALASATGAKPAGTGKEPKPK